MKRRRTYKLNGFTLAEVLITLVLTSLALAMAYASLTQVQKLYNGFTKQNKFLQQYTRLKEYLDYEAVKSEWISEESENNFKIVRDCSIVFVEIIEKKILLRKNDLCDTFAIEAKNILKEYEAMTNPEWNNKLIRSLQFETAFTKQKFNFRFYKHYDSSVKMALNKTEN